MNMQQELDRIRKHHDGLLRPEDVVGAAAPKSSPLHHLFEWDNGAAGHCWRLEQARRLIRVFVEVIDTPGNKSESRVFVALSSDRPLGGYRIMADVLHDGSLRKVLLQDAFADMERFKKKYSVLRELSEVFQAMERARRKPASRRLVAR